MFIQVNADKLSKLQLSGEKQHENITKETCAKIKDILEQHSSVN